MRKYVLAAALSVMVLAVGCSSDSADISIEPADGAAAVVITATAEEKEESGEGKTDESSVEAEESLKAREEELSSLAESVKAAEESLSEAEESMQEAMSSAEETAEEESEETSAVSYQDLIGSAAEYENKEVTYTGRVIQAVALDGDTVQLLIAVDDDDSTRMVGEYGKDVLSDALAHGDTVTVKGTFTGVNRYMTGSGERVELPSLKISGITVDSTAETEPETAIPETEPETVPETTAVPESEAASEAASEASTEETPHVVQGPIGS